MTGEPIGALIVGAAFMLVVIAFAAGAMIAKDQITAAAVMLAVVFVSLMGAIASAITALAWSKKP
jgi:hypothetical protein